MSVISSQKGISLIELIAAVVIFITVVLTLALMIPRMSANAVDNHAQSAAANLLAGKIQELQAQPYPILQTTYETLGGGPWFANTNPPTAQDTCDCGSADYALLSSSDQVIVDGIAFNRYWCIDSIQNAAGAWHAYCVPPGGPIQEYSFMGRPGRRGEQQDRQRRSHGFEVLMKTPNGFTLVECLVSLGIISLLVVGYANFQPLLTKFMHHTTANQAINQDARRAVDMICRKLTNAQSTTVVISAASPAAPPNSRIDFVGIDQAAYTIEWSTNPANSIHLLRTPAGAQTVNDSVIASNVTSLMFF